MLKKDTSKIKEFVFVIAQTRKLFFGLDASSSKKQPATLLQLHGLMVISNMPGCTVGELADKFKMSSAAIAQYFNRLSRLKWIEKRPDKEDKRISRIYLTEEGRVKFRSLKKHFLGKAAKLISSLTERELSELIRLHKKLLKGLEEKLKDENS